MADAAVEGVRGDPGATVRTTGRTTGLIDSAADLHAARARQQVLLWVALMLGAAATLVPAVALPHAASMALLKVGVAVLLTIIPGWLYAVYLLRRGESLYDEFVLNLFQLRIDDPANLPMPPRHTTQFTNWEIRHRQLSPPTTDNLYRRRFEGVYGRHAVSTRAAFDTDQRGSLKPDTFSPVVLATLVLGVGWTLTLQPELLLQLDFLDTVQFSGQPTVPVKALQFAFLGAYAFTLQDLVRRYFVVDLRNTAYVSAVLRIVMVTLIVAALYSERVLGTGEFATAFALGFFPRTAIQALEARTVKPLARRMQGRRNERKLAELEGMDIWQETRLIELGIENLQQFATTDLVEVLLRSRTPVERLVDWLDQALLLLLLPLDPTERDAAVADLRALGIRAATDFEEAVVASTPVHADVEAAMRMRPGGLQAAVVSLRRHRNYRHVRAFRLQETDGPAATLAAAAMQ